MGGSELRGASNGHPMPTKSLSNIHRLQAQADLRLTAQMLYYPSDLITTYYCTYAARWGWLPEEIIAEYKHWLRCCWLKHLAREQR